MLQRNLRWLVIIIALTLVALFIDWPGNPGLHLQLGGLKINRDFIVHEGLDLQGGMEVMLEANVPADQPIDDQAMDAARGIVENRINGLGVSEPLIQQQGPRRIIVELPGVKDPEAAIRTFGQTGLLEFVDAGNVPLAEGTVITTTTGGPETILPQGSQAPAVTGQVDASKVYTTVVTGKDLRSADTGFDEYNRPQINFTFNSEGAKKFGDFTANNVGRYLAISLDKKIISSPQIQSPITEGTGRITGRFSLEEANSLVIQLKYGALPIPLKVIQNRTVGPTLGQDSVERSLVAGVIGLSLVIAFMLAYYRLPGLLANFALLIYGLLVFAIFKAVPVTLTVAGIAGFILSIGMAVDANILIFERMREELRTGKTLASAIDAGFARAWTSIRDSNISTLITCAILFWFGMNFGASIIKGFALTLAIGVTVSMFTAVVVTRNFLQILQQVWFPRSRAVDGNRFAWLFGLEQASAQASAETLPARQ